MKRIIEGAFFALNSCDAGRKLFHNSSEYLKIYKKANYYWIRRSSCVSLWCQANKQKNRNEFFFILTYFLQFFFQLNRGAINLTFFFLKIYCFNFIRIKKKKFKWWIFLEVFLLNAFIIYFEVKNINKMKKMTVSRECLSTHIRLILTSICFS